MEWSAREEFPKGLLLNKEVTAFTFAFRFTHKCDARLYVIQHLDILHEYICVSLTLLQISRDSDPFNYLKPFRI